MTKILFKLMFVTVAFFFSSTGFACGDLDFSCRQNEGQFNLPVPTPRLPDIQIDPGCRGDICGAVQPVASEADRTIRNIARELGKSPEAIRECLGNVPRCANEILSAPIAMLAQAYIDNLYRQSKNNVFPFSEEFINLAQPYYEVDLRGVTYSDNINTGHGMTVAYCDRIFFKETTVAICGTTKMS